MHAGARGHRPQVSAPFSDARRVKLASRIARFMTSVERRLTRLAHADCTVPQIATITGHSLKTVEAISDKHYLKRDEVLAEQAMDKRVAYETAQLASQQEDSAL